MSIATRALAQKQAAGRRKGEPSGARAAKKGPAIVDPMAPLTSPASGGYVQPEGGAIKRQIKAQADAKPTTPAKTKAKK